VNIDRGSGCRVKDTVTIEVFPQIDESYTGSNEVCYGLNTQLHAPQGLTGSWTPITSLVNANDPQTIVTSPTNTTPIEYTFEYLDQNGCTAYFREEVTVLECIDLELEKNLLTSSPIKKDDIIVFELIVTNTSAYDATSIVIKDSLPSCVTYDFSYTADIGTLNYSLDVLEWSIPSIASSQTYKIRFDAKVTDISDCLNTAEVLSADQQDIDSNPNNDDGDQSEDDEGNVTFFICKTNICLPITTTRK